MTRKYICSVCKLETDGPDHLCRGGVPVSQLTESTVLAMVAAKLQDMRVLSVGATQTPSGQDIIIRLARKETK